MSRERPSAARRGPPSGDDVSTGHPWSRYCHQAAARRRTWSHPNSAPKAMTLKRSVEDSGTVLSEVTLPVTPANGRNAVPVVLPSGLMVIVAVSSSDTHDPHDPPIPVRPEASN
jgi:hypothetical protein